MAKPLGVGSLFEEDAHGRFMRLTGSRYDAMNQRFEKKKLPRLPFTKDQFREHFLKALGGHEDGFVQCKYCRGHFGVVDVAYDHADALSRGGSLGLENIEFPCQTCNMAKGSLTPSEFLKLLEFLEKEIPLGRQDVLGRLAKAVSLAQGIRSNAGIVNKLKKSGVWKETQKELRDAKKAKESGLPPF